MAGERRPARGTGRAGGGGALAAPRGRRGGARRGRGSGAGHRARALSAPRAPDWGRGSSPCVFSGAQGSLCPRGPGARSGSVAGPGLTAPSVPGAGEAAAGSGDPGAGVWQPLRVPP